MTEDLNSVIKCSMKLRSTGWLLQEVVIKMHITQLLHSDRLIKATLNSRNSVTSRTLGSCIVWVPKITSVGSASCQPAMGKWEPKSGQMVFIPMSKLSKHFNEAELLEDGFAKYILQGCGT